MPPKPIWKPSDIARAAGRSRAATVEPPAQAPVPVEAASEPVPVPEPEPVAPPEKVARRRVGAAVGKRTPPVPRQGRSPRKDEDAVVDLHVGQRVRLRRGLLGLSQTDLARGLGLTFQQVQKYERGATRISASMLHRLSGILDVPVSFFFDGLDHAGSPPAPDADPATRTMLTYARSLGAIPDEEVRRALVALARELAGEESA